MAKKRKTKPSTPLSPKLRLFKAWDTAGKRGAAIRPDGSIISGRDKYGQQLGSRGKGPGHNATYGIPNYGVYPKRRR